MLRLAFAWTAWTLCAGLRPTSNRRPASAARRAAVREFESLDHFEAAVESAAGDRLLVVDFSTSTCVPCQKFAPQLERVAEYYPECSFFAVVGDRSDVARRIARSCDVSEVPTFFLYKDGERQRRMTGGKLTSMDLIDAIEDLKYAT